MENTILKKLALFLLTIFFMVLFTYAIGIGVNNNLPTEYCELAQKYYTIMKDVKSEWNGTILSSPIELNAGTKKAYLFRIYKDMEQKGYFVVIEINGKITVSEATWTGKDPLTENLNKKYYIAPFGFYTKAEYAKININSKNNNATGMTKEATAASINTSTLLNVPTSYGYSELNSFYSESKILNTPEYFNFDYGPIINGCSPTAGAMLVAFYDNSILPNLSSVTLPMQHSSNKPVVDDLITELASASYMRTNLDNNIGTTGPNMMHGIETFFHSKGYTYCYGNSSTFYTDYSALILSRNPVLLSIKTNVENENHTVLGIGFSNVRYVGTMLITRYDWLDRAGEYSVNYNLFDYFIYIYHN